jgi:hypothetical protein
MLMHTTGRPGGKREPAPRGIIDERSVNKKYYRQQQKKGVTGNWKENGQRGLVSGTTRKRSKKKAEGGAVQDPGGIRESLWSVCRKEASSMDRANNSARSGSERR